MKKYLIVKQDGFKECGAASLLSIIRYYGGNISINKLIGITDNNIVCNDTANTVLAKKVFPNNTLIAGNPARILRNHVAWIRNSDDIYTDYGSYTEAIFDERDSNS